MRAFGGRRYRRICGLFVYLNMLTGSGEGGQRLKKYLLDSLSKYLLSNNVPNTQPGGVGKMG